MTKLSPLAKKTQLSYIGQGKIGEKVESSSFAIFFNQVLFTQASLLLCSPEQKVLRLKIIINLKMSTVEYKTPNTRNVKTPKWFAKEKGKVFYSISCHSPLLPRVRSHINCDKVTDLISCLTFPKMAFNRTTGRSVNL